MAHIYLANIKIVSNQVFNSHFGRFFEQMNQKRHVQVT